MTSWLLEMGSFTQASASAFPNVPWVMVCGEPFPLVKRTAWPALIVTGSPNWKMPTLSVVMAIVALGVASGVTAQRTGPLGLGAVLALAAMLMAAMLIDGSAPPPAGVELALLAQAAKAKTANQATIAIR